MQWRLSCGCGHLLQHTAGGCSVCMCKQGEGVISQICMQLNGHTVFPRSWAMALPSCEVLRNPSKPHFYFLDFSCALRLHEKIAITEAFCAVLTAASINR